MNHNLLIERGFPMKYRFFLIILLCLTLIGCGRAEPNAPEVPEVQVYTVSFWNGDTLLQKLDVLKGEAPDAFLPEVPEGLQFLGWEPAPVPATENADYYGRFVPVLDNHVPYLFPREDGFLHPDAPFTVADLRDALNALAPDAAKAYFPDLPGDGNSLTAGKLWDVLESFFPETAEDVLSAFDRSRVLTRGEAANAFNTLLNRQGESVAIEETVTGILDVPPVHPLYAEIMEAALPHTAGDRSWDDIVLMTDIQPGWHIQKGKAMYFDENGYLAKDTALDGGVILDAEGFQTSGNAELDIFVTGLLAGFQEAHPDAGREELLRYSFDYVRDSFFYLRKDALDFGATGWELDSALEMFRTGMGNCYNYAAAFSVLAHGLGYSAVSVSGTIGESQDPHGWTELTVDGEIYYCDPESEMVERSWGNDWNFFMLDLYTGSNFHYRCPRNTWED